jgi:PAS domain S-box-containing protein
MKDKDKSKEELISELSKIRKRVAELDSKESEHKGMEEQFFLIKSSVDQAGEAIAASRHLGYTEQELLAMSVPDIDPNFPLKMWPSHWKELKKNRSMSFETVHKHKNGTTFPVEVRINHIKFKDKEYNFAFARDITKRKKAKENLHKSEEKLRLLLETAPLSIFECDTNGLITLVNPSYSKITGYSEEELLQMHVWDPQMPGPQRDALPEYLKLLVKEQPEPTPYVCKNLTKDGRLIDVQVDWTYNRDKQGQVAGFVCILSDITQHRLSEEALKKAHDDLEMRVKERTYELESAVKLLEKEIDDHKSTERNLRDAEKSLKIHAEELTESNAALKVLLNQREQDQTDFENNILSNVKHLIMPYIEKLKKNKPEQDDLAYLNIVESNLKEIVSPFATRLSFQYLDFTPREIMIADLIKDGKHDKDIMEILNISLDTVKTHRKNIRRKLGIYGNRINLRTKLLSLTN